MKLSPPSTCLGLKAVKSKMVEMLDNTLILLESFICGVLRTSYTLRDRTCPVRVEWFAGMDVKSDILLLSHR